MSAFLFLYQFQILREEGLHHQLKSFKLKKKDYLVYYHKLPFTIRQTTTTYFDH